MTNQTDPLPVFGKIPLLESASDELSRIVGKSKGAGEVLSFCIALSGSLERLLSRVEDRTIGKEGEFHYKGSIDFKNVALMIVGRTSHPYFQFLGDIVSSEFDADKLDYLHRDATAAGLPLRYDFDRYIYSVALEADRLADGEDELETLYGATAPVKPVKKEAGGDHDFPYFDTYRLRLPHEAMNTVEQIVISKFMLFSYMYHHGKVRAAEGLLERVLIDHVQCLRDKGKSDEDLLAFFMDMTDRGLNNLLTDGSESVRSRAYRINCRLLPREVFRLSGSLVSHAPEALLSDYLTKLQSRDTGASVIGNLERQIGENLLAGMSGTPDGGGPTNPGWSNEQEAVAGAGVWVDVPRPPNFEDIQRILMSNADGKQVTQVSRMFPIGPWIEAYMSYKYYVRIFAFPEFEEQAAVAAQAALKSATGITADAVYEACRKSRR